MVINMLFNSQVIRWVIFGYAIFKNNPVSSIETSFKHPYTQYLIQDLSIPGASYPKWRIQLSREERNINVGGIVMKNFVPFFEHDIVLPGFLVESTILYVASQFETTGFFFHKDYLFSR